MTWVVMIFVMVSAAVLQTLLPAFAFLGHAKIPFLLAVLFYYALRREAFVMLIAGLFAGFLHDALSPIPLGYSAICFCILGWVAGYFRKLVMIDSGITHAVFGFAGGMVFVGGLYFMLSKTGYVPSSIGWVWMKALGTGIMGMLFAPIVFFSIGRIDQLVGNIYVGESLDAIDE